MQEGDGGPGAEGTVASAEHRYDDDTATDLVLPPEMAWAERADRVKDAEYVPAETSEGLEEVGGVIGWWEEEGHWAASNDFAGFFGPVERVAESEVLEVAARRALVEALALREQGGGRMTARTWERGGRRELDRVLGMEIDVAEGGEAALKGDTAAVAEAVRGKTEGEVAAEEAAAAGESFDLHKEEARELLKTWDDGWKNASLEDPLLKFAVGVFPTLSFFRFLNTCVRGLISNVFCPPTGDQAHPPAHRPRHPRQQAADHPEHGTAPRRPRQAAAGGQVARAA